MFLANVRLRTKLFVMMIIVMTIPISVATYIAMLRAEEALMQEKQNKLYGIARLLEQNLQGDYDDLLRQQHMLSAEREEKIHALNTALAEYTDKVANAYPGVGVGYYSRDLDAILTYGPSREYGDKVGLSIKEGHKGREVMETGRIMIQTGELVRGNIVNFMLPVERQGRVIGYIWSNELVEDIILQKQALHREMLHTMLLGIILALLGTTLITNSVIRDVNIVKNGLQKLKHNLQFTFPPLPGEIGEIAASVNDLSTALAHIKTHTENILESVADGVFTIDRETKITTFNRAAEKITGFRAQDVIGRPYEEVFMQKVRFHSLLLDTLQTGRTHISKEFDYPVSNGRLVRISASTSLLRKNQTEVIGAVIVFKDLSEKAQLEAQVHRADRLAAIGELAAGVAHELRNPLTAIKGFIQMFREELCEEEKQKYIGIVMKEVNRMNRIIEDLLHFARPAPFNFHIADVNEILDETLRLLDTRDIKNRIRIVLELDDGLPLIQADAARLKQVFLNIVINAVQAIAGNGTITITTRYLPGTACVQVSVADTGCGIPADVMDKLFDPFFTTKERGTGLGLSVSHRIVEMHHGRIEVESTVNIGSVFHVYLPLCQREESA